MRSENLSQDLRQKICQYVRTYVKSRGVQEDRLHHRGNVPTLNVSFDSGTFPTEAAHLKTPVGWPMCWQADVRGSGMRGWISGDGGRNTYFSEVCYPLRFARQSKQDAHIWIPRLGKFPNAPLSMPTQWAFSASPPDVPATTYVERTYVRTYVRTY